MEDNKRIDLQDLIGQTIVDVEQLGDRIVFTHIDKDVAESLKTFYREEEIIKR